MIKFSEHVRSLMIDNDKKEVSLILRDHPKTYLNITEFAFPVNGTPGFKFSISATGQSKEACEEAMVFMRDNSVAAANFIREISLPVFVGLEPILKTVHTTIRETQDELEQEDAPAPATQE